MTKYNVGDVLEITEDFHQLGADYKRGDRYEVEAVTSLGYNLEPLQAGPSWSARPEVFDRLETTRKVEPKDEFGVLPPVKPDTQEVDVEDVGGWDREEFATAAPKPETVSVDALREAYEYVNQEYLDLEKLIELAKRLS